MLLKEIKNLFGSICIVLDVTNYPNVDNIPGIINLGAVTLTCEDREFILDATETNFYDAEQDGERLTMEVVCKLIEDEETFGEESYTLNVEDLFNSDIKAEFYLGWEDDGKEDENEIKVISMETILEFDGLQKYSIITKEE